MRAAAERSPSVPSEIWALRGMQGAYTFVKEKSKWVGPNMSYAACHIPPFLSANQIISALFINYWSMRKNLEVTMAKCQIQSLSRLRRMRNGAANVVCSTKSRRMTRMNRKAPWLCGRPRLSTRPWKIAFLPARRPRLRWHLRLQASGWVPHGERRTAPASVLGLLPAI